MPAVTAANSCDPIESALRSSLETKRIQDGKHLDEQLVASAKRVLMTKIEYHSAKNERTTTLKSLQSKYIILKPNQENQDGPGSNKEEMFEGVSASTNGTREDCQVDVDGIPMPKVIIHPLDKVKLGWLRVYKIGAGLANLGNTCFLNATLQCLTYTPPLVNHLLEFNEHSATCKNVGFCMMCELQRHIRRALEKNGEIIKPQCILQKLKSIAAHMTWGRQEDAHEFLHYVMESMISSSINGLSTAKLDRLSYETTVVNQIFGGYHRSQVICLRCKEKSDTYDHFMDVMLDVKNVQHFEMALHHFVQPETLDNENAYMCPNCKQKCPARKRFTIHRAPYITTFTLKRFDYSRSIGGKITKHISFPEKFDMRMYMSNKQGPPITYLLYAVLVHQGVSCNSGHYFCFVRNSNNLWYMMDDSKVRQVSLNYVLSQQAYLLFYTQVPNNGNISKSSVSAPPTTKQPFTPVVFSTPSSSAANGNCSVINGNPVNESVGSPLARKNVSQTTANLVKPKPSLFTANKNVDSMNKASGSSSGTFRNASSSSSVLSSTRERISFEFKSTNAQNSMSKLVSGSSTSGDSAKANESTGEPKHPRIVMHIKNGKVVNYHQPYSSSSSNAISTTPVLSPMLAQKTSSLVPYGADSSEESDQDNCVRSAATNSNSSAGGSATVSKNPDSSKESLKCRSKLEVYPNPTKADDESEKVKGEKSLFNHSTNTNNNKSTNEKLHVEGALTVSTVPATCKMNATSQWLIQDSSQQSPSLNSEGSTNSVNSTTGWIVRDKSESKRSADGGDACGENSHIALKKVKNDDVSSEDAGEARDSNLWRRHSKCDRLAYENSLNQQVSSPGQCSSNEDRVNSSCKDSDKTRTSDTKCVKTLINGCKRSSRSPDNDYEDNDVNRKHRKKKRHYRKDLESPLDECKRKKREEVDGAGDGVVGKKKRRHSSSHSRSSDNSYEWEWVEKTKESLEEEKCQTTQGSKSREDDDKTLNCGFSPVKNGDIPSTSLPTAGGDCAGPSNGSATVEELLLKGGRGYGKGVNAWDGGRGYAYRYGSNDEQKSSNDTYNEELDRGKTKKIRNHFYQSGPRFNSNPFQQVQDMKTRGYNFKNRRHFRVNSSYHWDGYHKGGHHLPNHHNNYYANRNRHYPRHSSY